MTRVNRARLGPAPHLVLRGPARPARLSAAGAIIVPMELHGEYKRPGGKLVVVDLRVIDGLLADVEVSGDFFLEPPEALDDIVGALNGAPADASEAELASRISASLGSEAVLMGFDAQGVAVAVRRAVEDGRPRERL